MNAIRIIENPYNFEIHFSFHPVIKDAVKAIPGSRFKVDGSNKFWTVPLDRKDSIERFKIRFGINKIDKSDEYVGVIPPLPELAIEIPLKKDLFPFQRSGVAYALEKKRCIIGDQMGLGKTAQAIATIAGAKALPCLIICPASLKLNWQQEIRMWTNFKAIILNDSIKNSWKEYIRIEAAQFIIVNYESLKKYFIEEIKKPTPDSPLRLNYIHFKESINIFKAVILDESHRVKDNKTQASKFAKGICSGKEYILALTGTPLVNKPRDLVAQLAIIGQLVTMGGYKPFLNRFCEGYNGASNLGELNFMLNKHCFYRREKKDVLKELPEKMRQIILCDITTRKEYDDALANLETYLRQYKQASDEKVQSALRGEVMVRIGILKNISAKGKLPTIIEKIKDIIEDGEKMSIFVHLREVVTALRQAFPEAVTILGDDHLADRQMAVSRFQEYADCKLIICSIKAAGVGITLTSGSIMAFAELPWHPADCDQCEDRHHRIGQRNSVQCMYFLGKDTIDEHIYSIIEKKRGISNAVTGSRDNIEAEVIDMLSNSLFSKKKQEELI